MKRRILVVSRDATFRGSLARMLIRGNYAVELAESVKLARKLVARRDVALAIVAPSGLGDTCLEFVQELVAAAYQTIILAHEREEIDLLATTSVGAVGGNVHILTTKDERAILTQIRSIVSRGVNGAEELSHGPEVLHFDGLILDVAGHTLRDRGGEGVRLTRGEFALLLALARHPGRVLSRDQLGNSIAGHVVDVGDRSIDVMVWRLRGKIEVNPKTPSLILTVPGSGYKLAAAVRPIDSTVGETNGASAGYPLPARSQSVERRQLTVLSCELVEWAALSSRLDPEDAHSALDAFRRCSTEVVTRFGGTVAVFSGGEMQVYFGYPQAHEHDAERAVRAALGIVEAVAKLVLGFPVALRARIGIATGLVVMGEPVADSATRVPAVVGEAPVMASRLRSMATPGTVLIAVNTRGLVGDLFECRDVGQAATPDFPEPASAWQVTGETAAESRFEALHGGGPMPPVVGRDEEIDLLLRRWRQSIAGEGRAVLISGEPGIGKSRIATCLAERVAAEPHMRLRFQCSPYHGDSALHPVIARLERVAGITSDQPPEERLDRLEKMLAFATPDPAAVAPLFAALLSIPTSGRYPPLCLSPADQRHQTLAALLDQLEGLARQQPLLVLYEDVHWADATSLALLDLTIGMIPRLPVLAVITFRSGYEPPWAGLANVSTLMLSRLEPRYVRMMVDGIAGGPQLPKEVIEQIILKTDGIPLFVEELTKSIIESGHFGEGDKKDHADSAGVPVAIPVSLQSSLMARLDRRASAKEVAQIGAVIGRRFTYALLQSVVALDEMALRAALNEFEYSELVFRRGMPPEATYTFKHALVRDAAYDSLPKSRRQALHRQIAEALRDKFPALAETEPELVAHHFAEAGIFEAALEWWHKAGERALGRSAYTEAMAHLGKALGLAERLPTGPEQRLLRLRLHITYGQASMMARGHGAPETTAAFARARALAAEVENAADRFSAYHGLWVGSLVRGELATLREIAALFVRETVGRPASPEAGIGHRLLGVTAWFEGDYSSALDNLEKACAAYDSERDRGLALRFGQDVGVASMIYLALVLWALGRTRRARHFLAAADAHAERSEHVPTRAFMHFHWALFGGLRGDDAQVLPHAEALVQLGRKHGVPMWLVNGTFWLGWARWRTARQMAGLVEMREAMALRKGQVTFRHLYGGVRAEAEAESGQVETGLALLAEQLAGIKRSGQRWFEAELHRLQGELLVRRGPADTLAAEAAFMRSLEVARRQGTRTFELRAALGLAKLYRSTERTEAARQLLEPMHDALSHESEMPEVQEAGDILTALRPANEVPEGA